jgi:serine/threonine protein kinase/tetratricopeptide (TPR) repeat protein
MVAQLATGVIPFDTTGLPAAATFGASTALTGATAGTSADALPKEAGPLKVGQSFGPRYHIIKLLGAGGMGAVYQAWDAELSVAVALKVIRGTSRRASADQEKRFKTELLLARSVTHKNVVRIHDLGEIDGTKYITMSYVQGADLATLLRTHGKFPIDRSLRLARQIAAGLEAAHEAGVVHRDLKPANVMIGADDLALIMDFGISASADDAATGGIVGTLEYMAPEQGAGQTVDGRADIYAFGLIAYELLVGPRSSAPATAQERIAAMRERTLNGLPPLRELEPAVPEPLANLVTRCLATRPADRFQTTSEVRAALAALDDAGELIPIPRKISTLMLSSTAAIVLTFAGSTYFVGRRMAAPPVKHPVVSVLVADLDNKSGDSTFDGALGTQALATVLEGAPYVSLYPSGQAHAAAAEITVNHDNRLTPSTSRLLARRDAIKVLVESSIERNGGGFRIGARIVDPVTDATLGSATANASDRAEVPAAFGSVAGKLRIALGESKSEMEKSAAAETFTAASLDAMQAFQRAQDLVNTGKVGEAAAAYQDAIKFDPQLGRAYSGLAIIYRNLGQMDKAEATFKEALKHVDRMTDREKYRMLGAYYFSISRNYPKAIETYETLVAKYPGDQAALSNLAFAYGMQRNFGRAEEISRQLVQLYPRYLLGRNNYASYALYAGDFTEAIAQGATVLQQNPTYQFAFLPRALAQLSKGDLDAALATYARLAALGPFGASLSKLGLADFALYQGRFGDAASALPAAIAIDEKDKNKTAAAAKYVALAEAQLALGKRDAAVAAAKKASTLAADEVTLFPAAMVLITAGHEDEARAIADTLGGRLEDEPRSYARLIDALVYRAHHRLPDAIDDVKDAQKRHDSWWSRYLLGVFYEELAQPRHAEALAEFELAIKRRGEAADAFIADTPTLRYLPPAYYWLGRAQEGMEATAAARKSYGEYLAIRGGSTDDPLAADARKRLE